MKAVLLDLDGVVIDSRIARQELFKKVFLDFGFLAPSEEEVERIAPYGSRTCIRFLLPNGRKNDEDLIGRMAGDMRDNAPSVLRFIKAKQGMKKLLAKLKKKKIKTAIVTNRRKSTYEILEKKGLSKYFDAVITAEDSQNLKPHPEPLEKALEKLKISASQAVYFGDTEVDAMAGAAAGVKTFVIKTVKDIEKGLKEVGV